MVANINIRKQIEILKAEIKLKETKIEELGRLIDSLQQKIGDQGSRLDILSVELNKKPVRTTRTM